ncbi:MAG: hypothetical protein ACE5FF_02470 [Saprospiraceae bacterium]
MKVPDGVVNDQPLAIGKACPDPSGGTAHPRHGLVAVETEDFCEGVKAFFSGALHGGGAPLDFAAIVASPNSFKDCDSRDFASYSPSV